MTNQKTDIGKVQGDLFTLVEKRIKHLEGKQLLETELDESKSKYDDIKKDIRTRLKTIEKELNAIDKLMKEKLELINKNR